MTKRVVIGPRSNGDIGLFVSPSGVDADTASDPFLLLSITGKVSQLILLGHISSSTSGIVLGLSNRPFVFLTSQFNFAGVPGHTTGAGPLRPSPGLGVSPASATIQGGGATMDITTPNSCVYAVYSHVF
jgi:hypothetical protein